MLRSTNPAGLEQEMWALLTAYQALRRAMVTAVESRPGTDPDRASFTTALHTARDLLVHADGIADDTADPVGGIGRAVLDDLHPPRRARTSVRKVKSPLSRYNKKDPTNAAPRSPNSPSPSATPKRKTRHANRSARQQHMDLNYPALGLACKPTPRSSRAVSTRTVMPSSTTSTGASASTSPPVSR